MFLRNNLFIIYITSSIRKVEIIFETNIANIKYTFL